MVKRLVKNYPDYLIVNFDALTYAGNLENLKDVENAPNYVFVKGDIVNDADIIAVFEKYEITDVIHLAAESHVDRSIMNPIEFVKTNVLGTINLLNVSKSFWKDDLQNHRFHHVSTDEVYGALDMNPENKFTETTPYNPHSPYSASKASSDHFVKAYHDTYGMNVTISNCSNNYGPYHFPEKLIPLIIANALEEKELPVYGEGKNVRDWLYVRDHCKAIDLILEKGRLGEVYNIGGHNEKTNLEVVKTVLKILGKSEDLIRFVKDRPGHDLRYAIDPTKIRNELGWYPETTFEEGIKKTTQWYLENRAWWENIMNGDYVKYYEKMYKNR